MGQMLSSLGSSGGADAGSSAASAAGSSGGSSANPLAALMFGKDIAGLFGGGPSGPPPQAIPLTRTQGTPVAPITVPAVGITGPLGTRLPPAIMALLSRLSPGGMG